MKPDAQQQGVIITPDVEMVPTQPVSRRTMRTRLGLRRDLPLGKQVWLLAKWPLLEQLMAFLVGFVDVALSGHLPDDPATAFSEPVISTNAIGVASYLIWLMGLLQGAVGVGGLALIARATGARHRREANAALGQAMGIGLLWGLFIGAFFLVTARPIGVLFNLQAATLDQCTIYIQLLAVAAPFMALMFVGGACLRGAGDFRSPFVVMVVVNIVNVVVSVLLVQGPEPIGGHGIVGIALGTVAAWVVGGAIMVWYLLSGRGGMRLHLHRLKPHKRMATRIIRISVPNLVENLLHWLANGLVLWIVVRLAGEPNAVGAHIIAIRLEALSFLPGVAFAQAASTMVGQYLGAGDPEMARKSTWTSLGYAAVIMGVLGLLFILIPQHFVRLMTTEPEFVTKAASLLRLAGYAQIGFGAALVLSGAMRGAGDTRNTMVITFVSMYMIRIPLVWLAGMVLGWGLWGVWLALTIELILRGVLFLARFIHGGWQTVRV